MNGASRGIVARFLASVLLLQLGGCGWGGASYWLALYQSRIDNGTRAIESARSEPQRAAGYAERARGYAEKARYSRVFKLIEAEPYGRLFDLAIKDHDEAVRLDPGNAETYVGRGLTYYERAAAGPDNFEPGTRAKEWFALSEADFNGAVARDGRHERALDMRGMIHEHDGDYEQARVMESNPTLGRIRLADLYCGRAGIRQRDRDYASAASDYERSIALGASADGCSCDPYSPLAWTYLEGLGNYNKSWEIVRKAQAARRWIQPELIERLRKGPGRQR